MSNDVIRVGDRFELLIDVTGPVDPNGMVPVQATISNNGLPVWGKIAADVVYSGKRLPRPLKVGDRVRVHYGAPVTIKAIDGSDAWVMTEDGGRFTTELNFLTPAEESAS